jgi:hypothetical protein
VRVSRPTARVRDHTEFAHLGRRSPWNPCEIDVDAAEELVRCDNAGRAVSGDDTSFHADITALPRRSQRGRDRVGIGLPTRPTTRGKQGETDAETGSCDDLPLRGLPR